MYSEKNKLFNLGNYTLHIRPLRAESNQLESMWRSNGQPSSRRLYRADLWSLEGYGRWLIDKCILFFELGRICDLRAHLLTLYKDLRDFGVAGTESTVDFKTVCIVQEGASEGKENFLQKSDRVVT